MGGMEIDPRTGEPRRQVPVFLRLILLLVLSAVLAYILISRFGERGTDMDLQELAYRNTGLIKIAQWEYHNTYGRFATLEELKKVGKLEEEIISISNGVAQMDFGITARCSLPMDRADFDLRVDYGDGEYRTSAHDNRHFNDFDSIQ